MSKIHNLNFCFVTTALLTWVTLDIINKKSDRLQRKQCPLKTNGTKPSPKIWR